MKRREAKKKNDVREKEKRSAKEKEKIFHINTINKHHTQSIKIIMKYDSFFFLLLPSFSFVVLLTEWRLQLYTY